MFLFLFFPVLLLEQSLAEDSDAFYGCIESKMGTVATGRDTAGKRHVATISWWSSQSGSCSSVKKKIQYLTVFRGAPRDGWLRWKRENW